MAPNRKICVGVIRGAHGVRGQIRLRSFTENPEAIFTYKPLTDETGAQEFSVKRQGDMQTYFVASLKGTTDREAAEVLRGTKLFVTRSVLPPPTEGQYYDADLVGLTAQTDDETVIGKVEAVHDYGAGTFLEIKPANAKSFMLPFKTAFVPDVNIKEGFVKIIVPEGWLANEKPPKSEP